MNNLDNLKLTDLIDVKTLQDIQDGFSNATGMAALTTDENGVAVTQGSNFTDFCMELNRKSSIACQRCEQCDKQGGEGTMRTGRAMAYSCHAGLVDFAAPIMLNGKFIGSFIGGQVLPEPPDEEQFRRYATEVGIDPDRYINALRKVKIVPKHQIDMAADFLCTIANVLSKIAYSSYVEAMNSSGLSTENAQIISKISEANAIIKQNEQSMEELEGKVKSLEEIAKTSVEQVNSAMHTVKEIQNIATNTKILGFNAYVEAAHAREYGKGFGVITQEIRALADQSKITADKIEDAITSINTFTKQIDNHVKATEDSIAECSKNMSNLSVILDELKNN